MAYFLKQTHNKKGTYLQIYSSFYNPEKKQTSHKSFKPIGYVDDLKKQGISDPISYYKEEIEKMNADRQSKIRDEKAQKVSDTLPIKYYGYFPIRSINNRLGLDRDLCILQLQYNFKFNVFELLSSLVYARVISPCSKHKTFFDVLPYLIDETSFSRDQMYEGLRFLGIEYERIIEIYNHKIQLIYGRNTDHTYFDCTNFFFEIDKEDDLRRKGPSKEKRTDPIVGMGLLLDNKQIPIGMKIYPGNMSEKPIYREVIQELKDRNNIKGKTIRVADKGLNCTANIMDAILCGDGYLFSKSVKTLPEKEKTWVLLDNDYVEVKDKKGNLLYKTKSCIDKFPYMLTDNDGKKTKVMLCEKRVVTYNPSLAKKQIAEIDKEVNKALNASLSSAKRAEYGSKSKYMEFITVDKDGKGTDDNVKISVNMKAVEKAKCLAGYNLLVTSEVKMTDEEIYNNYHNLWRIEESFRMMKSAFDARPVYLQREDSIIGHFLICYIAVLLMRLLQIEELDDQFGYQELIDYMRSATAVDLKGKYMVNLTKKSDVMLRLKKKIGRPIDNYYLTNGDIKNILNYKFR